MPDMSPEAFKKFFVWLSASVQTASTRLGDGNQPIEMPAAAATTWNWPRDTRRSATTTRRARSSCHARCREAAQAVPDALRPPALRRRATRPSPATSLEVIEQGDADLLPPINSSQLDGCPACPYCGNPAAGMCPCGQLFCSRPGDARPGDLPRLQHRS